MHAPVLLVALCAALAAPGAAALALDDASAGAAARGAGPVAVPMPPAPAAAAHAPPPASLAVSVDTRVDLPAGLDANAGLVPPLGLPPVDAHIAAAVPLQEPTDQAGDEGPKPSMAPSGARIAPAVAVAVPLAAAGAAAGGLGLRALQGAAATWGARLLRLIPVGLFSRIERGQLLENPVRARVHDAVAQDPGLTLSEVQARAGIAWGTTVHHLHRLESNGLLVSISQGAHRRYFVPNTPAAAQRSALACLRHPTTRRVAAFVHHSPGQAHAALCHALGLNGPRVSKQLRMLRERGLVTSQRIGRQTLHHPTPALGAALGLAPEVPAPEVAWLRPEAAHVRAACEVIAPRQVAAA